jgi:hypothetical protein
MTPTEKALRDALRLALTRMAHHVFCAKIRPTEEWKEHDSRNFSGCQCEISKVEAALALPETTTTTSTEYRHISIARDGTTVESGPVDEIGKCRSVEHKREVIESFGPWVEVAADRKSEEIK